MSTIKEFTREEFEAIVSENDLETFTKSEVDSFRRSFIERKDQLSDLEKSFGVGELATIQPVIVRENNLQRSVIYCRSRQVEPIESSSQEFGSILKSQNLQYRDTELNRFRGYVGIAVNDKESIEKSKALPIGTTKTYGNKEYVKTEKGWRLKKKGEASKKEVEKDETAERLKKKIDSAEKRHKAGEGPIEDVEHYEKLLNDHLFEKRKKDKSE